MTFNSLKLISRKILANVGKFLNFHWFLQELTNENDDIEEALKSTFSSDQVVDEDCTCFMVIRKTHYFDCKKYTDVRIHPHYYPPYRKSTIAEEMKKNRRAFKSGYSTSAPADLENPIPEKIPWFKGIELTL